MVDCIAAAPAPLEHPACGAPLALAARVLELVLVTARAFGACGTLAGEESPKDAAEDSYNILPILLQEEFDAPLRQSTILLSVGITYGIRQGKWKLLMCGKTGGWNPAKWDTEAIDESTRTNRPAAQLYNMDEDPGEQKNLSNEHPEVV